MGFGASSGYDSRAIQATIREYRMSKPHAARLQMKKKLIKTAPGYVEKTPRTAKWIGEKKRCGVCQVTKPEKHFEAKRQVCNECRGK
jgi:hypothetical protein